MGGFPPSLVVVRGSEEEKEEKEKPGGRVLTAWIDGAVEVAEEGFCYANCWLTGPYSCLLDTEWLDLIILLLLVEERASGREQQRVRMMREGGKVTLQIPGECFFVLTGWRHECLQPLQRHYVILRRCFHVLITRSLRICHLTSLHHIQPWYHREAALCTRCTPTPPPPCTKTVWGRVEVVHTVSLFYVRLFYPDQFKPWLTADIMTLNYMKIPETASACPTVAYWDSSVSVSWTTNEEDEERPPPLQGFTLLLTNKPALCSTQWMSIIGRHPAELRGLFFPLLPIILCASVFSVNVEQFSQKNMQTFISDSNPHCQRGVWRTVFNEQEVLKLDTVQTKANTSLKWV